MKIKHGYVLREIASQHIAIPTGSRVNDLHGMIALNETGAFLWRLLEEEQSIDSLTASLLENYDTSYDQAQKSVKAFLAKLSEDDLLDTYEDKV